LINILIIIILIIIILLVSIMMIPFHITLNLNNKGLEAKGYFKITWMKIRILKRDIPSQEKEEKEKEVKKKTKSNWNLDRIIKVFNLFLEALPHFEKVFFAFIKSITLERFDLDFILGLESPVDTAQMAGFFWSLLPMVNLVPKISINMRPIFMKTTFEGNLEIELKIKLLWIVFESLKAFTKKPVRNFISEVRA
jgi:hypothetical protein